MVEGNYSIVQEILSSIVDIYTGQQKADILVNLGCYKTSIGDKDEALNDFNRSLGILKNKADPVSLAIANNNKAVIEIKNYNYKEAFKSAKAAITLVEPLIFEKLMHTPENALKENKSFQEKLHVLLIAYRNFSIVQKKLNNIKYAKTVYNH